MAMPNAAKPSQSKDRERLPGIVHEGHESDDGGDADRQVDVENPAPGVVFRASRRARAHDGSDHYAHAEQRHGPATSLGG